MHNCYGEIVRKLERVACAVFFDEIFDAERNVHRLHLFCGNVCGKRKNPVKLDWVLLCPSGHTTEPAKGICIIIIHEQRESVKRKGLVVSEQKRSQNRVDLFHRI